MKSHDYAVWYLDDSGNAVKWGFETLYENLQPMAEYVLPTGEIIRIDFEL